MKEAPGTDAFTSHVRSAIEATIADLDHVGVEGEDRSIVLRAVLALRLGGGANATSIAPAPATIVAAAAPATAVDDSDVLGKIASAMKLKREVLELVYDVQDGQPGLVISAKRLSERKAEATKVIAQLVAGARQAAGLEEWTGVGTIRAVVNDFGRLDGNNFAVAIQGLDKVFLYRGKSTSREVKVTRAGMEEIAALITSLVGDASQ